MNPNQPVFGSGWALMFQNRVELGWVGPLGQNLGQIQVGFGLEVCYISLLANQTKQNPFITLNYHQVLHTTIVKNELELLLIM